MTALRSIAVQETDASGTFEVSVVISTYNRCEMLPAALEGVLCQRPGAVRYEVILVDNNSTDGTREVVESFIARGHSNLRYVFEARQGVSHGRNAGVRQARSPIIAFTDDDIRVAEDWVAQIKRAFDEHPEVDFLGGKILPRREGALPSWLTREHWAPLALQDYGDEAFHVDGSNPLGLVSGNLSFRREALEGVGMFAPELQRVKDGIGSMEDHELLLRLWRAGRRGLYLPGLIVTAEVPAERLTKAYHRRWHTGHGHFYAVLRAEEFERSAVGRLFDVPAHLYRQAACDAAGWLKHWVPGRAERAFAHEARLRFFVGFLRKRRRDFLASATHGTSPQVRSFLRPSTLNKALTSRRKKLADSGG